MSTAVTQLSGVGPKLAENLAKLGIHQITDLVFHLPSRYEDRTRLTPMADLVPGTQALVEGDVTDVQVVFRGRRMMLVHIEDDSGQGLTMRFFRFGKNQQNALRDKRVRCFGEVRQVGMGVEMAHPEYRVLDGSKAGSVAENLTPIYPLVEGLGQERLRKLVQSALTLVQKQPEILPDYLGNQGGYSVLSALQLVHAPTPDVPVQELLDASHPATQRLIIEELLAQQLAMLRLRSQRGEQAAPKIAAKGLLLDQFWGTLEFSPTGAQTRVIKEIRDDIRREFPMHRLVQGDVGSGKTLVAAAAALDAIEAGYQVALMAPTELLAEQHFHNFAKWFDPLGIEITWLAGRVKGKKRNEALHAVANGCPMVIGTHALFQADVEFKRLGLTIVDEQHRFGVDQRMALKAKGNGISPHQLNMTATPIPRTLAMTAYADLDVSVIDELPPGRTPVTTIAVNAERRMEVVERVARQCQDGAQAYWVCPLIEESETLSAEAAEETAIALAEMLAPLRVGLLHGKHKADVKEVTMANFKNRELDLLVATTVIEVGVDVPNATLMVIENAERLGLAQLHQLRGRVGRGSKDSYCVLMQQGNLSEMARSRIAAMRETTDGFVIAEEDLRLRGPGEMLGTRQTGLVRMKIADIRRDRDLLPTVKSMAEKMLAEQPGQIDGLISRWVAEAHYGAV